MTLARVALMRDVPQRSSEPETKRAPQTHKAAFLRGFRERHGALRTMRHCLDAPARLADPRRADPQQRWSHLPSIAQP
jgi:hypothetical protein